MKLLTISHSAVVAGYHDRYAEVVRQGEVELTLLVPEEWRQFNRRVRLEKRSDPRYRIVARQPICWRLKGHGLRNVTHIYPGMGKLIKEIRPEIIELWEEPFSAVTAHTIYAARKTVPGAKIIFFSARNIRTGYHFPFSWFERYTYRHADFAFVMNREAEEIIRENGWRKGARVLPLGVNPETFRKEDAGGLRRRLNLDTFTIGFVGKLEKQKGVLDLIRACADLKGGINLLLIGRGPLLGEIERLLTETGLAGATTLLEAAAHEKLPAHLNCMDILVLPAITLPGLKEQFGRVLIEAMACGVPVIGSSSGEIPRVIGEAGLVFPEGESEELAARIKSLRDHPEERRRLGELGRKRVEQNFTWEILARRQIQVYHKLISSRPAGR